MEISSKERTHCTVSSPSPRPPIQSSVFGASLSLLECAPACSKAMNFSEYLCAVPGCAILTCSDAGPMRYNCCVANLQIANNGSECEMQADVRSAGSDKITTLEDVKEASEPCSFEAWHCPSLAKHRALSIVVGCLMIHESGWKSTGTAMTR